MWGDMERHRPAAGGEAAAWGDVGRCGEMWGDVGRCGEMWGDTVAAHAPEWLACSACSLARCALAASYAWQVERWGDVGRY